VKVDRDDKRELFTVMVQSADGTTHPARSLSDGTLRFLALAVLEADPNARGLLCLEEPENGIHPERIDAILQLLKDLATDVREESGEENPLRQMIITTHSPTVVAQVPDESLLFAERGVRSTAEGTSSVILFRHLPDTWRANTATENQTIQRGQIVNFLRPLKDEQFSPQSLERRVIDNPSVFEQLTLVEER